jgi:hypothetical protein
MLIEKSGHVEFLGYDPDTKRHLRFSPQAYLTPLQAKMLSTQPDMILQLAHSLARRYRKVSPRLEIRVEAWASLHGRPRQRFIDPKVDLTKEHDTLWPKRWILPLDRTSPPSF